MLTVAILKLITWVIGLIPSVDFSAIPEYVTSSSTLNIFAWVNFLLPVNMMSVLLTLTGIYYGAKFIANLIKFIFHMS